MAIRDLPGERTVVVGATRFTAEALARWDTWNQVETQIKRMKREPTPEEWDILGRYAIGAGANGFRELRSAMSQAGFFDKPAPPANPVKEAYDRCRDILNLPEKGVDFENMPVDCVRDLWLIAKAASETKA